MENASKALIMAGGILIAIVLISTIVIVYNNISELYSEESETLTEKQLTEYNNKFAAYSNTSALYGSELLSLANLAQDYNTKLASSLNYASTADAKGDAYYDEYAIELDVKIFKIYGNEITDEDAIIVTDVKSKILKKVINGKLIYGTYSLSGTGDDSLITYYNELVENSKSTDSATAQYYQELLTELKSLPFKCVETKMTTDNSRIKYMLFEQILE